MNFRVWAITNPPRQPDYYTVAGPTEGKNRVEQLIEEQLLDDSVWGNAFGLQIQDPITKDWSEWHDECGMGVLDLLDQEEDLDILDPLNEIAGYY
jgi:hypothetical protein